MSMYPTYINRALRKDVDQVFDLLQASYKLEVGTDGIAFRTKNKFTLKDQVRKSIGDMLVIRDHRKILGCVVCFLNRGVAEVSVLAVLPEYQNKGYGTRLLEAAENKHRCEKCTVGVPSCRTDVIPFFNKHGYKEAVRKSVAEMRKLYGEDLAEKRLSRQDIEWVIMVKNMDAEPDEDEEAKKALSVYPQET